MGNSNDLTQSDDDYKVQLRTTHLWYPEVIIFLAGAIALTNDLAPSVMTIFRF